MLSSCKETLHDLRQHGAFPATSQKKRQNASKILESAKNISMLLDNFNAFDLAEEDLDQELDALGRENAQLKRKLNAAKRNIGNSPTLLELSKRVR